jgi:hypothetical protein
MDTITETSLKERMALGQVVHFRVVEADGKYQLLVRCMWQESEVQLITQRKQARTWSSMDSLLDYTDKTYGAVPIIFLRNFSESDANELANGTPPGTDLPTLD